MIGNMRTSFRSAAPTDLCAGRGPNVHGRCRFL